MAARSTRPFLQRLVLHNVAQTDPLIHFGNNAQAANVVQCTPRNAFITAHARLLHITLLDLKAKQCNPSLQRQTVATN